jgi:hypothetical protein
VNYTELIKRLREITLNRDEGASTEEAKYYHVFALELHNFFERNKWENYLFSFPFVSEKGKDTNPSSDWLISEHLPQIQRDRLKKHLIAGEEILKESENAFSLTQLMVENLIEEKIQSILLKSRSDNIGSIKKNIILREYINEFIFIDLRRNFRGKRGKFTEDFEKVAEKLKVKEHEYEMLYERLIQFIEVPAPDHFFYLIKPTANHKQFNVVLALALRYPLVADEFHLLRLLIYRFVSEVAIKKLEEFEGLRRKKSFSLTTHALKTEINTTIKPKINNIKKEIDKLSLPIQHPLNKHVNDLKNRTKNLFCMASFITLIDKVKDKNEFVRSGSEGADKLLVDKIEEIDIYEHCENYNLDNKKNDDIVILPKSCPRLSIKVYDVYFSKFALQNFLNTLFENLEKYGKRNENSEIELRISKTSLSWEFENDQKDITEIDESKLTGNLLLFQVLIEDTESGKFSIDSSGDKFKVIYEFNNK